MLLGTVPGVLGVKTGGRKTRENLVTYIERDGHKVLLPSLAVRTDLETKSLLTGYSPITIGKVLLCHQIKNPKP